MRRLLLSLGLAVAVGATVFGAAATLSLPTTEFAAGDAAVVSCDIDGVGVNWDGGWDATLGYYKVTELHVYGVADACLDMDVFAMITGPSGALASQIWVDAPEWDGTTANAHWMDIDVSASNIPVSQVTGIHVMFDYFIS